MKSEINKTVIIPDVHCHFDRAEAIILKEVPDEIVFLGDYFDAYDETMETHIQTVEWLKGSMKNPRRIHLLGNHDLSYLDQKYTCSGYTGVKKFFIDKIGVKLEKLLRYYWIDETWLCTHAGLSYEFYKAYAGSGQTVSDFLETYDYDVELRERLYNCSNMRGGMDAYSGIVWCDYGEFVDIPDIKQIFGHTNDKCVRHLKNDNGSEHYCLDTSVRYYAVYENGQMRIEMVK